MHWTHRIVIILISLSFYLEATPQTAAATSQISSARAGIQLVATMPAQLKLSISEVNLVVRVDDVSQSSKAVSVPITSSWVLNSSMSKVEMVGYFDSEVGALMDNIGHTVPADHVIGGISQDQMFPFVESSRVSPSNASRTFFRQDISDANFVSSRTDILQIQVRRIDDLGLPPAEYRGVLHLRLVSY